MTRQLRVVGKNRVAANLAIVGQMDIGHEQIVITHPGHTATVDGAGIESAKLSNGVAVADHQTGWLSSVFFVLRRSA